MRWFQTLFISLILIGVFFPSLCFAQSSYVLPYPSSMPGSSSYRIRLVIEKIEKYWYFGNFGQFNYHLKLSDKYLIEAKTLFEYNQYLLGYKALKKSDFYFRNIEPYLVMAKTEGKDTLEKEKILKSAVQKHKEILNRIQLEVPEIFDWQPEKDLPTKLYLHKAIKESINVRRKI